MIAKAVVQAEYTFDAAEMGRAFAGMNDDDQALFWNGVAEGTKEWPDGRGYSSGEGQWGWMWEKMQSEANEPGRKVLMAMCSYAMVHAFNYLSTRQSTELRRLMDLFQENP